MQQRSHIGVTTEVSVQSSPTNQSVPSGRFQIAGVTVKGPLNYQGVVTSPAQYVSLFGGRAPYETLYDTVRLFFAEGGAELHVTRAVGPAATNGSVTLRNAAATPADVLSVEVVDPGPHSADYQTVVSTNADNTFNLSVVDSSTNRVIAQFSKAESPADLVSLSLGHDAVIIRDLGGTGNPAPGLFNLTAGTDDKASVDAARYGAVLAAHKGIRAGVAVAIPGQPADLIDPVLGEHCEATGKIGLPEIPVGATIDQAKAMGAALLGSAYGSHLAMPLFPAIRVPDGNDRTRTVSPVGYAAAHRSQVHRTQSFAAPVAGPRVKTLWNFRPILALDETDINELNQSGVNGIQSNQGVPFLNNWSSQSNEAGLFDLNVRDALNNLTVLLESGLQELIWKPNDGRSTLFAQAQAIIDQIMLPLVTGGYLFPSEDADGNLTDSGYVVDMEDIRVSGQGAPYDTVQINLGVKLSPTLRHVHVPIRKTDLRSAL